MRLAVPAFSAVIPAVAAAAAFAATAALPGSAHAQAATPTPTPYATDERPMLIEPASVADPAGPEAFLFNPAQINLGDSGRAVWIHSDRPQANLPGDGDAVFLQHGRSFGLGLEWARPAKDVSRPLIDYGAGIPLGRSAGIGVLYTSTIGKTYSPWAFHSWSFGGLWRPARFLSLGATAWNAFTRQSSPAVIDLKPRYAGGVAIRPLTDRVTLTFDAARTDGVKHVDLRYGLRAEPVRGLSLYVTADDQKRYTASLAFSFSHTRIGTTAFRNEDGDYIGTATRLESNERRQPTVAKFRPAYARMKVGGSLPDESGKKLFHAGVQTMPDVLDTLERVRRDRGIDGAILRLDGLSLGLARAQELRDAILGTRSAGKKVLCYVENADFRTYYVAAACDRIAMHPAATLDIAGVGAQLDYVKGTLDKLGIGVETARVGPYKGAPEPLIQKEPSPQTLEVTNALLDAAFDATVDGIAKGRNLEPGEVRAAIDGGFYSADAAKKAKLVDYVCYPDELSKTTADFLGKGYDGVGAYRSVAPERRAWGAPPRIGILVASGGIAQGKSRSTPLSGEEILGSETLVGQINDAANDPSLKAVVLRVDSPGGDGFASDEVWHAIEKLKKKKPVVVSMANVAASGGYYISMGANEIWAEPGTITGSIGVFMLKPNLAGTFDKIDYHTYLLSRGQYSQLFTLARPWTPEEKDEAGRLIDMFYRDFLAKAAKGRKTTPEAVDAVARGHVWVGAKAKELGLVDKLGGLEDALDAAAALAHIPKSRYYEGVLLEPEGGPLSGLGDLGVGADTRAELAALAFGSDLRILELLGSFGHAPAAFSLEAAALDASGQRAPARTAAQQAPRAERKTNPFWPIPDPRRR